MQAFAHLLLDNDFIEHREAWQRLDWFCTLAGKYRGSRPGSSESQVLLFPIVYLLLPSHPPQSFPCLQVCSEKGEAGPAGLGVPSSILVQGDDAPPSNSFRSSRKECFHSLRAQSPQPCGQKKYSVFRGPFFPSFYFFPKSLVHFPINHSHLIS